MVFNAFYEQAEIHLRELQQKKWPTTLGIDEHFFSRSQGHVEFCTVFTDLKSNKLFEVGRTKNTKALLAQLESIPGREQVKLVCIDLSSGYRALVKKLFPNAQIVADKFHVLRLLHPEITKPQVQKLFVAVVGPEWRDVAAAAGFRIPGSAVSDSLLCHGHSA